MYSAVHTPVSRILKPEDKENKLSHYTHRERHTEQAVSLYIIHTERHTQRDTHTTHTQSWDLISGTLNKL